MFSEQVTDANEDQRRQRDEERPGCDVLVAEGVDVIDVATGSGNAAIGVSWQIFLVVLVFVSSLFTGMSVRENLSLSTLPAIGRWGVIRRGAERARALVERGVRDGQPGQLGQPRGESPVRAR